MKRVVLLATLLSLGLSLVPETTLAVSKVKTHPNCPDRTPVRLSPSARDHSRASSTSRNHQHHLATWDHSHGNTSRRHRHVSKSHDHGDYQTHAHPEGLSGKATVSRHSHKNDHPVGACID